MEKDYKKYIPNIKLVNKIQKEFNGDFHTQLFDQQYDFQTYLCALAYGAVGKELFVDEHVVGNIPAEMRRDEKFMQGMLQYSIIQKINKAKFIMESTEFKKTKKVDFSLEDKQNDYATIAFIIYYLNSQGYSVEWNKMCHDYSPINVSKGPVEFKKGLKQNVTELIESVEYDIKHRSLIS